MDIFDTLIFYMQYPFVRYALIVGTLIALCSSLLGVTLVLKRFSFIGDGLSHVAFGAIAIASIFILAPTNGTFFSGFIIAMGIAGLFVGAIPFGPGLYRMVDYDGTTGIVATLSCLVVFAVFIYKIIAGCSAT